ncbi:MULTISPECIES: sigma-70 family RNA polymerase sigma factor [Pseudomonas]|uniref:sigma-70 family RNA polymerase sigma factor n=1 Tax=Pseudomonas TaxID=286 RepID=UPI00057D2AB4|nr:sigma-70 family RNA polymerase sigma factor [Pseudomonas sp. C5pp]KIC83505.1 RNA polymerase sigma factor [Pseudomonas sp. C5pp]
MADSQPVKNAFFELYGTNHRWLRSWLYRRLQCPHDAADLAQDTFLRVMKAPQSVAIEEPRAFLATVARRLLSNLLRRRALERAYLEELANLTEACAPSEEELALVHEALVQIDQVLHGLPRRVRHVFILSRLDGLPQPQIARQLGISIATVERDLRRAFLHCLSVAGV